FFFSSRRRHTRFSRDWSSDVCSSDLDRYGDIWGGFILKHLADLRGDAVVAGGPMIRHLKAGDYTRNIWQEHVCHLVNDEFLELRSEERRVGKECRCRWAP